MLDFPHVFAGTHVVKLEQNYRSSEPILETTNRLIAIARERYAKSLFTKKSGGDLPQLITCSDEEHDAGVFSAPREAFAPEAEGRQANQDGPKSEVLLRTDQW